LSDVNIEKINAFRPSYVWPNPAIHFRIYYESDKCRIFLIENIVHNWKWLKEWANHIQDRDFFFVSLGWHFDNYLTYESAEALKILGVDKSKFKILFNDFQSKNLFEQYGFHGEIVNQNCFLDFEQFNIRQSEKLYDAIYTARFVSFKRHYLASKVPNLALVAGNSWQSKEEELEIPKYAFLNDKRLTPEEVAIKISESKVGLILSESEGACYSSSEYLLCGLPVVSTWSNGGRSVWLNDYNSIICDANPDAVEKSVTDLIKKKRDPKVIREMHVRLSNYFRKNFINLHDQVLASVNDKKIAKDYFFKNYKHKLFTSETPNFSEIFK